MFQIRELSDGSYSVMARVWVPEKRFYEHPEYIDIWDYEQARSLCQECIDAEISVEEILDCWVFIGD